MPSRTLSDKLRRVYADIDSWRTGPLERGYPYVFMDGVWRKRSWGGSVENVSVLVAVGVDSEGRREVIGVAEGMKEDSAGRERFFGGMIERGLRGVGLVVDDRRAGLVSTVRSMLPRAGYRRCMVRFMRNVIGGTGHAHAEWAGCARVRYVTADEWSSRRYLDMSRLGGTLEEVNRSSCHGRP